MNRVGTMWDNQPPAEVGWYRIKQGESQRWVEVRQSDFNRRLYVFELNSSHWHLPSDHLYFKTQWDGPFASKETP